MTDTVDVYTSPRPITMTVANILDANAIKTTIATVAADTTYSGAALNGADVISNVAYPTPDGHTDVPQYPCAVAAANPGSYVDASTVQFTGKHGGEDVVRTATVVGTGGGATFIADGPVDSVSSILVEAQANTGGSWEFGFTDIGCWRERGRNKAARAVRADDAEVIGLTDEDGHADLTPFKAGEFQPVSVYHLVQSTTAVTKLTIYK